MKAAMYATLLLVPLLVGGCDSIFGDDEGEVELSVDGAALAAGDDVTVRVFNGSDENAFFNLCFLVMDVRAGNEWLETDYFGQLPCPAIDPFWPGIAPGSSMDFTVMIPEEVPAGTYRLRLGVGERDQAPVDVATPPFEIMPIHELHAGATAEVRGATR